MFDCVHQPLSYFGAPPFHAGQAAYNQLVCAWELRAAAHSLICGGQWEPEGLNNTDQQTKTVSWKGLKLPGAADVAGCQSQPTVSHYRESFDLMLIPKLLLNRPLTVKPHALNILGLCYLSYPVSAKQNVEFLLKTYSKPSSTDSTISCLHFSWHREDWNSRRDRFPVD